MKKNILWLLLAAMLFSGCSGKNTVNEPVELPDKTVASGDTSTSIVLDGTENSQYVMAGQNGAIILVETISDAEYEAIIDYAVDLGIEQAFVQEGGAAEESFIPAFDYAGVEKSAALASSKGE